MSWRNVFGLCAASALLVSLGAEAAYRWQPVVWGGGGYVTGMVFHPSVEGLLYARTDVGGAYRRDPGSRSWIQLLDTLPDKDAQLQSVWSVAVDPSNSQLVYLAAGLTTQSWGRTAALMKSADRGKTWTQTDLPVRLGGAESGRAQGERLQVDPNSGSVLFLGTTNDGLYKSTDSGRTWAKITTFPASAVTFVVFDAASGASGKPTPHIFVAAGSVVYHSTDAGASWQSVSNQPKDLLALGAAIDGNSKLYVTYANTVGPYDATSGSVYSYTTAAGWKDLTPPGTQSLGGYAAVAVSARSPDVVAVATAGRGGGDDIYRSLNGGRTWTSVRARSTESATDASAWIGTALGRGITSLEIDPFSETHVVYNFGAGVYETDNFLCRRCAWQYDAAGMQQSRVAALASPASGAQLLMAQGGATADDGAGVDYAHWWPNFVVRTADADRMAFLSGDNGQTWSPMPTSPATLATDAGRIAVAAGGSSILWAIGGAGAFVSTDSGKTWASATGYPRSNSIKSGTFFAPVADRFENGVYYTYDFVNGVLLESTDAGSTFAKAYGGLPQLKSATTVQLVSLPTKARDLWLVTPTALYHMNGRSASAQTKIDAVQAAYGLGYGAAAPGKSYPTLYLSGQVGGVAGLFQSVDTGASWTRIDSGQYGGADRPDLIAGDQKVYGRIWVAPGARGLAMGTAA